MGMRTLGAAVLTMVLVGLTANCGSDQNKTSYPRTGGNSGLGRAGSSGGSTSGRAGSGGKGGTSGESGSAGGCTQIKYVDYPCFHDSLRTPKCSQDSPGIRVVGQEVSCQEATGTSCCSGGGCRPTDKRCEEGQACAYPDATPYALDIEAKCLPESQLCGGAQNKACPMGQYCERYGVFFAMGLRTSTACEYADGGGMGVCHPLPSESECAANSRPVCGCDGVTYANDCARKKASAAYASSGECYPGALAESSRDGGSD
jgi:hypothetical protein